MPRVRCAISGGCVSIPDRDFNHFVGEEGHRLSCSVSTRGDGTQLLNFSAFVLFILPAARRNWVTLNVGCFAIYAGCYIDKGMGLIIPGLTPDTLGEIYVYFPTMSEFRVASGVFAIGFLVFTLMLKVAVPISLGEFQFVRRTGAPAPGWQPGGTH